MVPHQVNGKMIWLTLGMFMGLGIASFWPHERALATVSDRNDRFAMVTCPVTIPDTVDAVFVMDLLTGRLTGAVLNNREAKFTQFYYANLAADFRVDPKGDPQYAFVSGRIALPNVGDISPATGAIYVAEFTSGKVACYGFPYRNTDNVIPPVMMTPIDVFPFRQAQFKE
ncbi:MAG: hypothetical protein ACKVT0_14975 [Planctomycetaceae bacterium]